MGLGEPQICSEGGLSHIACTCRLVGWLSILLSLIKIEGFVLFSYFKQVVKSFEFA